MSPSIINPPTPPKPADRDYRLGLKPGFERAVIEEKYLALKPCLHGCDAHSIDRIGKPDQNRYCWIKGDLSFESIPQSVIEPEERVWIGDAPPKALGDSTVIDKIRPHGMPWLQNDSIALNGGFVAVIGARGSGKTALVDMIAAGAQAPPDSSGQLLVSQTGHRSSRGFGFVWMSQARFRSGWNGFPRHTSAKKHGLHGWS